jgi:NAD(P)-dependent dehydrogenase (short-subunit alcohol dehydrogenase family)
MSDDPRDKHPKPFYPSQQQNPPGLESKMDPLPDYGEKSYKGSGKLKGKAAVITGGDSGIGRAVALAFAREGADVLISYMAEEKSDAKETVRVVESAGQKCITVPGDICEEAHCQAIINRAVTEFGKVDILVNNAATNPYFGPFMDIDMGAWDKTFDVNVKGYFWMTREVVKHLRSRDAKGSIVNVASVAGLMASPAQGVYAMTKAAIVSMTKTLAYELSGNNIRVNAIAPGFIDTELTHNLGGEGRQKIAGRSALKRLPEVDDVASMVEYLLGEGGRNITGTVLTVDAGNTA